MKDTIVPYGKERYLAGLHPTMEAVSQEQRILDGLEVLDGRFRGSMMARLIEVVEILKSRLKLCMTDSESTYIVPLTMGDNMCSFTPARVLLAANNTHVVAQDDQRP